MPSQAVRRAPRRPLCWLGHTPVLFRFGTLLAACLLLAPAPARAEAVRVREQDITIPTYLAGDPEPNPIFYFGRNSQGAQGRVYPYPLYDSLTDIRSNKTYRIVYLENEYIRVGVLPEIGGRLFEAVDKANGYNFVYRQHVIKPALIGLIGAWISGGVEWNIPHHHRATTFLPVQYRVEQNPDGSKTVWVGELELRDRMRWAVGYTLSPGSSCLTAKVRILNRTPLPHTMLCFANLAVHVDENYQVIFPPRTQFVTHHAKREFASWPIARGTYAGADFGTGTDVSWYSNHLAANSMFAWNYEDDFFAGYDHGRHAGTLSVADHHLVPGKKFWTWGSGPRGRMWDKILTDNDGPYIELMTGGYSDNQPDYSWLQPFETKSFEMHFYPFRDIGGVKNANLDGAVNLEATNGIAQFGFCTTAAHRSATALLKVGDKVLFEEKIRINPARPFVARVPLPSGMDTQNLRASLSAEERELIAYSPIRLAPQPKPEPVTPPPAPAEIKTVEELYLAGRRIEQFHAPAQEPEPYWEEALRRDPGNARVNLALGIRRLKQARFAEAERHLRKSLERLAANYTTPPEGDPFYYLGVALQAQGKQDEAVDAFHQAAWSEAWRGPAWYSLAEIATRRAQYREALDCLDRSLSANSLNLRALTLKAALLRHTGRAKAALALLTAASEITDPLDVRLLAERWLAGDKTAATELDSTARHHPATTLETAVEYCNAGLWQDAEALLAFFASATPEGSSASPLACYFRASIADQAGNTAKAAEYRQRAMRQAPDYVFPFQWEAIDVLRRAMDSNPRDARAPYYLGNLLFDWQPDQARKLWEQSAAIDPSFPIVQRNLALCYSHQKPTNDLPRAISHLEQAVAAPQKYALHFTELDELYAATGASPEKRLVLLEQNHGVVSRRDDALSREIGLKVFAGKYDEAIVLMTGRKFSVWEGGSLEVAEHWVQAHLLRGRQALAAHNFSAAMSDFDAAKTLPDNLPSDQRGSSHKVEIAYWIGVTQEVMGEPARAKQSWQEALEDAPGPESRRRGESRLSERQVQACFQALAKRRLGQHAEAENTLRTLLETAEKELARPEQQGESQPASRKMPRGSSVALAHCVAGLAHLGLDERDQARREFESALEAAPDFVRAKSELSRLR